MIRRNLSLTIQDGKRNKQTVLKDFVRPAPASIISSPTIVTSPYSGNIPGCAGDPPEPRNPCAEASLDLVGQGIAAGGWPNSPHGTWRYYPDPEPPAPGITTDLTYFSNWYLTGGFPADELIPDGPAINYWDAGGNGARLYRQLWAYRQSARQEVPFGPTRLEYFGGAFVGGAVYLDGLADTLSEQRPFEVLVTFTISDLPDARDEVHGFVIALDEVNPDTFVDSSLALFSSNCVRISYMVEDSVGVAQPDRLLVSCDGVTGPGAFDTTYYIANLEGCGGQPMQQGKTYSLRMLKDNDGVSAKLWLTHEFDEPESWSRSVGRTNLSNNPRSGFGAGLNTSASLHNCGPQWDTPCLDFADGKETWLFSAIFVNPSGSAVGSGDCDDDVSSDPGFYIDTLVKHSAYWLPASTNVSRYHQVYFDGVPVYEGTHYWLDGLKLYPQDPSIFADTLATATVVIE